MKMLKPLNSFVYIKNNPKKIIPQVFAVSLGVFLIYFICIIGGGLKYELNNDVIVPYEKMSTVTIRYPEKDNDELYNYFSKNNNVQKIMYSSGIENIPAKLVINSNETYCPYLNEDNIKYMMNMYNFKLQSGRIPQNNNEVLFNESFCKSRNLNVGDYYGTDVNSKDSLDGKYKIAGTFKGDIIMSFVYDSKSIDEIKNNPYSIDKTKIILIT